MLLEKIPAGVPTVEGKESADDKDKLEETSLTRAESEARIDSVVQSNLDKKANRELKWKYARWIFFYLVSYSIAVLAVLLLSGLGFLHTPEIVLSALVGSTAVSAIGLVGFVVSGLFKN